MTFRQIAKLCEKHRTYVSGKFLDACIDAMARNGLDWDDLAL